MRLDRAEVGLAFSEIPEPLARILVPIIDQFHLRKLQLREGVVVDLEIQRDGPDARLDLLGLDIAAVEADLDLVRRLALERDDLPADLSFWGAAFRVFELDLLVPLLEEVDFAGAFEGLHWDQDLDSRGLDVCGV